ncbi:hypothetical protein BS78_10G147300 [Paspalum vaginatum]|nr:hypothetical protein BS78_10G147300 [Paspalum vaginatum]
MPAHLLDACALPLPPRCYHHGSRARTRHLHFHTAHTCLVPVRYCSPRRHPTPPTHPPPQAVPPPCPPAPPASPRSGAANKSLSDGLSQPRPSPPPPTTIPASADQRRCAKDAKLFTLGSATRSVTTRAAVFWEPSSVPSDASAISRSVPYELPPARLRASSFIQHCREIKAVRPATPCDLGCAASTSMSDSDTGSPCGLVGCIIKKLSGAFSLSDEKTSCWNVQTGLIQVF